MMAKHTLVYLLMLLLKEWKENVYIFVPCVFYVEVKQCKRFLFSVKETLIVM